MGMFSPAQEIILRELVRVFLTRFNRTIAHKPITAENQQAITDLEDDILEFLRKQLKPM